MFILKTKLRNIARYNNKDWAIHSAKCCASFYSCAVWVIDVRTGEIVYTAN